MQETLNYWKQLSHVLKYFKVEEDPKTKLPNNFMHVGLIHLILPNARIIDARRHPLGCCLSGFKQHFARGQNFTYDLAELGSYYRPDDTWYKDVHRLIYRPSNPDELFMATGIGLYRSQDAGRTWKRFDKVQVHGTIMSVGLHQTDPKQVYIGARYEGEIFGTQDGGETWTSMPLPGPVKDIYSVACG